MPAIEKWNESSFMLMGFVEAEDESSKTCSEKHSTGFEDPRGIQSGESLFIFANSFHPKSCQRLMVVLTFNSTKFQESFSVVGVGAGAEIKHIPQKITHLIPPEGHSMSIEKNCE